MKVTTKIVWDMNTLEVLEHEFYEYEGPVELLKYGSEKAAATAEQKRNDDLQQKAFDAQQSRLEDLKKALSPYMTDEGQGFDPQQLAIMKAQFLNSNSDQFNNAGNSIRSALAARGGAGGALPVGGDFVRALSGLQGARASSMSGGLANINLQNLQQALTNKFNSASVLSGNAATLNGPISTFGAGANNALDIRAKLGMAPTFGNAFGPAFGGALGAGLGKAFTTG